ncbi:MAG: DUF3427 domain-containing protein [Akkermansia sp.]|nr:DUF3427 domain-containing protein [Akkermansia sp.]
MDQGFYDLLLTCELEKLLSHNNGVLLTDEPLSKEGFWHEFPSHFANEVANYLKSRSDELRDKELYNKLRGILTSSDFIEYIKGHVIPTDGRKLLEIAPSYRSPIAKKRPDTPLSVSALLTGAMRTPKLVEQIKKELETCDRADWMVSFIKMTGLNPLKPILEEFTTRHRNDPEPCLRIATTTYMGVTEGKAIEWLKSLPNTEVRVSYDTKHTRLHAKTYIFHRKTGYGSAYIGSSNISKVAMDNGLEWNVKVSQREVKHLWDAAIAAFETNWEDANTFEPCKHDSDIKRLKLALDYERKDRRDDTPTTFFNIRPFRYQEEALESIARERVAGKNKHLIIAATGTGKTMIAAFDYLNFCKSHPNASLLFLAHRKEILSQARTAFRQVTRKGSLGSLVDGTNEPTEYQHWFCTIQSWQNKKKQFPADHFQYIVVDEAHHGSANSYVDSLNGLAPISLLGLTATPERMDGLDIRPLFGGNYTHELRLGDAIERTLLCPFVYYGISDESHIDYRRMRWVNGKYDNTDLSHMLVNNEKRAAWVLEQMHNRLDDVRKMKAIGFCINIEHAEFMADFFNKQGVPAIALSSRSSHDERHLAPQKLQENEVSIIFTVDLYNEGVDIPDIDTVVFLRPTESLTVFLQQLGRGLRRSNDKENLVVFDFIAPAHKKFNYTQRFKALASHSSTKFIEQQVETGFSFLPTGCSIHLEKQAQEYILRNIKEYIDGLNRRGIITEIKLHSEAGSRITLNEIMQLLGVDTPDVIYSKILPSLVHGECISENNIEDLRKFEKNIRDGIRRLLLQDDGEMLQRFANGLNSEKISDEVALASIYTVLWGNTKPSNTLEGIHNFTVSHPNLVLDLREVIQWLHNKKSIYKQPHLPYLQSLQLHASYTSEQVLLALNKCKFENCYTLQAGVLHEKEQKMHIFFATINKDESAYSPTTMYEDYAISSSLFHWQSQSTTSANGELGQSYIKHKENGYTILLFIRERKKTAEGITSPYVFLGPVEYVKHEGSKPINIVWHLKFPMPAHILAWAQQQL